MYVCMYICKYVCMYVCMYVIMYKISLALYHFVYLYWILDNFVVEGKMRCAFSLVLLLSNGGVKPC